MKKKKVFKKRKSSNKIVGMAVVAACLLLAVVVYGQSDNESSSLNPIARLIGSDNDQFEINAAMNPASPLQLQLGQSFLVEVSVTDTNPKEDEPWTLCGIIAGEKKSTDSLAFDYFRSLIPGSMDIAIIQDQSNPAYDFPAGGIAKDRKNFVCDNEGTEQVYFHYMTSRKVSSCDPASQIEMQNDSKAESKSIFLGQVECFRDIPEPSEEAGVIHSPGIETETDSADVAGAEDEEDLQ